MPTDQIGPSTEPNSAWPDADRRAVDRAQTPFLHRPPEGRGRSAASVLTIDDQRLFAEMMVRALRADGFIADFVEPCTMLQVRQQAELSRPTLALVDLDLASKDFDGFSLVPVLLSFGCDVVTLANSADRLLIAASLEAGAIGCIAKTGPFQDLLEIVKLAARKQLHVAATEEVQLLSELRRRRAEHDMRLAPFRALSPRERHVLAGLLDGRSAEAIAASSFVSIATVRSQIRGVLSKLRVASQIEVMAAARQAGWTPDGPPPMVMYSPTLSL